MKGLLPFKETSVQAAISSCMVFISLLCFSSSSTNFASLSSCSEISQWQEISNTDSKHWLLTKMSPSPLFWLSSISNYLPSFYSYHTSHFTSTERMFCRSSKDQNISILNNHAKLPTFWFFKSSLNSSNSFSTLTRCSSTLPRKLVTFSFHQFSNSETKSLSW